MDPELGFTQLAMSYAPGLEVGATRVIDDLDEWAEAWDSFDFVGEPPPVDFERRHAVLFVEGDYCAGGGEAPWPVTAVHVHADGTLVPEFAWHPAYGCPDVAYLPRRTGYAYALAIPHPRARARARWRVVLGSAGGLAKHTNPNRPAQPTAEAAETAATLCRASPDGSVPLPAPGETRPCSLRDDTLVWIVRHQDGRVTVLAAAVERERERQPGLRWLVRWRPNLRSFDWDYDEWGTHISGHQPGLERHRATVVRGRVVIGERDGPAPPGFVRRPLPPAVPGTDADRALSPIDDPPRATVCDGLRATNGAMIVVDGVLKLDRGKRAVLCAEDGYGQPCRNVCVPVVDVRTPPACEGALIGRFAVQREPTGFRLLFVVSAPGRSYRCATGDFAWFQSDAFGPGTRRNERLSYATTLALGTWSAGNLAFGAELAPALRYRFRAWPSEPPDSWFDGQLGDHFELAVRARFLRDFSDQDTSASSWTIGLSPCLCSRGFASELTGTTLLGALLPEAGVALRGDSVRPYVGWRFAVEWRLYSPMERQRPYALNERIAFEVAPAALFVPGDPDHEWLLGLTLGSTVW